MNHPPDSERAVSELFGAMVLIGVIVTGLAIAGVMLLSQPQPQKIPDLNALFSSNAQTVQIQHNGGDSFLKSELQIRLDGQDKTSSFAEDGNSGWTTWSVGQSLTYDVPSSSQVPSLIQIVYTGSGISQLIAASGEGSMAGLDVQAPVVDSITPNSGNVGDTVHITNLAGSYFFSGATVKLSHAGLADIPATNVSVVSSTQITCDFDLTGSTQGAWDVVVTNPNGPSGTLSNGFTVLVPLPTITGISPVAGPTTVGTNVNITGTNLTGATSVTFGSNAATINTKTATTINMTAPAHAAGTVTVTVTTTPGSSATTSYTYTAAPTISRISPTSGPLASGTLVNITGTNLAGATSVTFGSNAATINTNTAAAINMTAPAGPDHVTVTVTVTTPGGTATILYNYFTIISFTNIGATTWTVPPRVTTVDYLVVAGGGGGGYYGGGGGAGGFLSGTGYSVTPGAVLRITVGAGGTAGQNSGTGQGGSGGNSTFANTTVGNGINADGGGGGGSNRNSNWAGLNGGSGGGAVDNTSAAGTGISSQGHNGALGFTYQATRYNAGGGGGAGDVGQRASSTVGGVGGTGSHSSISGTDTAYAGGGGGGGRTYAGSATDGGGAGGTAAGTAGTANTGGGGGGGGNNANGAAGGSGIVIIMYY